MVSSGGTSYYVPFWIIPPTKHRTTLGLLKLGKHTLVVREVKYVRCSSISVWVGKCYFESN